MKNIFITQILSILAVLFLLNCSEKTDKDLVEDKSIQSSELNYWVGYTSGTIHGIDVSHHQDTINWDKVKEFGITFVFVKATEGIDYLDTLFNHNWQNVSGNNMIRGAYHFYISEDDPVTQAHWFVSNVKSFDGILPPVIDVERAGHKNVTVEEYQKKLKIHLEEVEKLTGRQPLIYSSPNFAAKYLTEEYFGKYKLWIAEYGVDEPRIPPVWQTEGWHFWQDSFQASVPGVPKKVDRNRYAGKYADLLSLIE